MGPDREPVLASEAEELVRLRLAAGSTRVRYGVPEFTRARHPLLSYGQRRLWFLEQLHPHTGAYNVSVAYRIEGPLDTGALEKALMSIVDRHEILRTHYGSAAGEPYQVVTEAGGHRLDVVDVSGDGAVERAQEVVDAVATTAFNLATGPVLRAVLVRLGETDHVLALAVHHIAFDRDSLQILATELTAAYAAFHTGSTLRQPPLEWQYADVAARERVMLSADVLDRQLAYWRRQLAGAPTVLPLSTDHPHPAQPSYQAGTVELTVEPGAAEALRRYALSQGMTLFTVTLAALHVLLTRHTGSSDVLVGCGFNARPRMRSDDLIGFFTNTLPIRATTAGDPPFSELARQVADAVLDAHQNQDLPFDVLVERLAPQRDASRYPIVQIWFDCVAIRSAGDAGVPALAEASVRPWPSRRVHSRFDLEVHLTEAPGEGISGRILYATDLFDHATVAGLASHYRNVLRAVAADPEQRVSRIEVLDAEERRRILEDWGTAGPSRS